MTTTLANLQEMLAVDGYTLTVTRDGATADAVITAADGICDDCLVPKKVMAGLLSKALEIDREGITLTYPDEKDH